jgi:ParB family chromosome partitioning protein
LLLNLSPYGVFEDVAAYFVKDHENHDKTDDETLLGVLDGFAKDKLTGFALRLVLTDHISIPRENEPDLLAGPSPRSLHRSPNRKRRSEERNLPPQAIPYPGVPNERASRRSRCCRRRPLSGRDQHTIL